MVLDGRLESGSDWMEAGIFAVALVVGVYLAATGPWQAGGPTPEGACPVRGDVGAIPLAEGRSGGDLGAATLYVTVSPTHAAGRGCVHESLEPGETVGIADTTVGVTEEGTVTVDGHPLEPGTTWDSVEGFRTLSNPWYRYRRDVHLYSTGTVDRATAAGETRELDGGVVVVTGTVSRRASLSLVTGAMFYSAAMLVVSILLEWSVRYADRGSGQDGRFVQ